MRTVTITSYGMGNLGSVANAVESLGHTACISSDPDEIAQSEKLILPGVGAFCEGMDNITSRGLKEAILQAVASGTHVLGICLGMQMFMRRSFEFEVHEGLSFLPGDVKKMDVEAFGHRLPHIGWNVTKFCGEHPIISGIPDERCFYYINSYACFCEDQEDVIATFDYGHSYAGIVARDNIVGVQFHPEKSQRYGLELLGNFIQW